MPRWYLNPNRDAENYLRAFWPRFEKCVFSRRLEQPQIHSHGRNSINMKPNGGNQLLRSLLQPSWGTHTFAHVRKCCKFDCDAQTSTKRVFAARTPLIRNRREEIDPCGAFRPRFEKCVFFAVARNGPKTHSHGRNSFMKPTLVVLLATVLRNSYFGACPKVLQNGPLRPKCLNSGVSQIVVYFLKKQKI